MIDPGPVVLEGGGIRLEPLADAHHEALAAAAADGRLWDLWFTTIPPPEGMRAYVADALKGQRDGHMLWPDVRRHLDLRLARHGAEGGR